MGFFRDNVTPCFFDYPIVFTYGYKVGRRTQKVMLLRKVKIK